MSDTTDPGGRRPRKRSGIVIALQIVLGILFLLPGACGGLFYGSVIIQLIYRWFRNGKAGYADGFLLFATPSILLSIVLLGLLLRAVRWSKAPTASLVLSITATVVIVSVYFMLYLGPELILIRGMTSLFSMAIIAWLVAAVPPFLHWWSKR